MSNKPGFQWYCFWRTWRGTFNRSKTYRRYGEEVTEEFIEDDCAEWAEQEGPNSEYYNYGFDAIDLPPEEWLREEIHNADSLIAYYLRRIVMLKEELTRAKAQNDDSDSFTPGSEWTKKKDGSYGAKVEKVTKDAKSKPPSPTSLKKKYNIK